MDKQTFFSELQELLEFEDIEFHEQTNLKTINGFDSLSVMTIIAYLEDNFGKRFSAQQISEITTIQSLLDLVGSDQFES